MVIQIYSRALQRYPIFTQSVATGLLLFVGDAFAQHGIEKKTFHEHQWDRSARMSLFGLVVAGPSLCYWYRFLDRQIRLPNPFLNLTTRVAVDQFLFSPVSVATFFTVNTWMEGGGLDQVKDKLHQHYWKALVTNWKVWIGVQYFNFAFVPLHHRLLVVNLVALGWNAYMSKLNAERVIPS